MGTTVNIKSQRVQIELKDLFLFPHTCDHRREIQQAKNQIQQKNAKFKTETNLLQKYHTSKNLVRTHPQKQTVPKKYREV
jgi:hypothetical protein